MSHTLAFLVKKLSKVRIRGLSYEMPRFSDL